MSENCHLDSGHVEPGGHRGNHAVNSAHDFSHSFHTERALFESLIPGKITFHFLQYAYNNLPECQKSATSISATSTPRKTRGKEPLRFGHHLSHNF